MRLIIQRISEGKVTVNGQEIGRSGPGACLFLGIARGDSEGDAEYLVRKALELRLFEDEKGKLNRSLLDTDGDVLLVSEFTLYADCTKGRRPSFGRAAPPDEAEKLYHIFAKKLRERGVRVATGQFQAKMEVSIVNNGPVTFIVDSK